MIGYAQIIFKDSFFAEVRFLVPVLAYGLLRSIVG